MTDRPHPPREIPADTIWLVGDITPGVVGMHLGGEPTAVAVLHLDGDGKPDVMIPLGREALVGLIRDLVALIDEIEELTREAVATAAGGDEINETKRGA